MHMARLRDCNLFNSEIKLIDLKGVIICSQYIIFKVQSCSEIKHAISVMQLILWIYCNNTCLNSFSSITLASLVLAQRRATTRA